MEETQEKEISQQPHVATRISNFFSEIMSINEAKVSCLLLVLIGSLSFGAFMYYTTGDINKMWADIIETTLYCVMGINVSDKIAGKGGFLNNIINK